MNPKTAKEKKHDYYMRNRAAHYQKQREYIAQNPEKVKAMRASYVKRNAEKIAIKRSEHYQKNKEHVRNVTRDYVRRNKAEVDRKRAIYLKKNRKKIAEQRRIWSKKEKSNNEQFDIATRLRKRIHTMLRRRKASFRTMELLGCSLPNFMLHIQKQFKLGMNWNNRNLWHIDHILPCASFDMTNDAHVRQCFHYTNMQPLWATENLSKSDKLPKQHQPSLLL